jgi:uncharacterized protein
VAAFGAFVDIGVHQDGLIHISALAEKFVKDAHDVVKAGQVVKVKVLEVDIKRQRVALTMRLNDTRRDTPTKNANSSNGGGFQAKPSQTARQLASLKSAAPAGGNAIAEAFAKLRAKT